MVIFHVEDRLILCKDPYDNTKLLLYSNKYIETLARSFMDGSCTTWQ